MYSQAVETISITNKYVFRSGLRNQQKGMQQKK